MWLVLHLTLNFQDSRCEFQQNAVCMSLIGTSVRPEYHRTEVATGGTLQVYMHEREFACVAPSVPLAS